ncbi:MAG: phenylalanine--tRNA ligase subunit beta [bacterium]
MKYSYNWLKDYLKTDKNPEELGQIIAALGSDVEDVRDVSGDTVLDLEITPNRGDLLSHFGMARDISAYFGAKLVKPSVYSSSDPELIEGESRSIDSLAFTEFASSTLAKLPPNATCSNNSQDIGIEIKSDKCSLYSAVVIKGVKVKESPDWLKERLIASGAKPINNIVDVTNYIMLDLGHPLHAFDLNKITPSACPAKLEERSGVISNADTPSVIASEAFCHCERSEAISSHHSVSPSVIPSEVEGSNPSKRKIIVKEIENDMDAVTLDGEARVLLPEMLGIWDSKQPIAIAGVMGLKNSEVDEKTTDIVLEAAVFDRKSVRKTAKLLNLKTEASARFERGVDAEGVQYAIDKAAKLIQEIAGGINYTSSVVEKSEASPQGRSVNGFSSSEVEKYILKIEYDKINSYADLNLENKKIDEILENLGFEIDGATATIPSWRHDIAIWQDLAEEVYRINGIEKIEKIPLPELDKPTPSDYHKKEKIKDYLVELGLDESISYTFLSDEDVTAAKIDASDLLEVANPVQEENRYLRNSLIPGLLKSVSKNPSFDDIELFELGSVFSGQEEWMNLAIVTSGKSARPVEKLVESICGRFNFDKDAFKIYEIPQEELKRFKIKKPSVQVAEAKISDLLKMGKFDDLGLLVNKNKSQYRPISKFPAVKRDLAFVIDKNIESIEIRASILEIASKVILAEIFDEFESDKLGKDKKSVAFHIWLEDQKKTLLDSQADEIISKIVDELKEKFGAELRS